MLTVGRACRGCAQWLKDWTAIAVKPLVVDRIHIFSPLAGPMLSAMYLMLKTFEGWAPLKGALSTRWGTGDADTWCAPAAIRLKFWGTPDDLPRDSVNLLAVLTASRGGKA